MSITEKILCSKSHEYLLEENGNYLIGLTDYAIEQLGDIVFVELPETGSEYKKGDTFATIESVKAASEIYMPISGKIIEVNAPEEKSFQEELTNDLIAIIHHFSMKFYGKRKSLLNNLKKDIKLSEKDK